MDRHWNDRGSKTLRQFVPNVIINVYNYLNRIILEIFKKIYNQLSIQIAKTSRIEMISNLHNYSTNAWF